MGFILPYLFITNLGSEANGLLGSMGQLFIYLNLLEAGVGATSLQALYKPVVDNDYVSINGRLAAAARHYLKTGVIYAAAIIAYAAFYPFLVETSISTKVIRIAILTQGIGSLVSYSIRSVYILLLQAEGDMYIISAFQFGSALMRNVGKIAAIYYGLGIIGVQCIHFVSVILETLCIIIFVRKKYGWINLKVKPEYSGLKQSRDALVKTLTFLVFNRTDTIIITVLTRNLILISIYSVYSLVFEAIQNFVDTISNSYQYKIGQSFQVSKEQFICSFKKYRIIITYLFFTLFLATYFVIKPFLCVYTKDVEDANYILAALPELFFTMKVLYAIRGVQKQAVDAVGHFKATKGISIIEMLINILTSIPLVLFLDIRGAIIGTVIALIYGTFSYCRYVDKKILDGMLDKHYYLLLVFLMILMCISICIGNALEANCDSYLELILYALKIGLTILGANGVLFGIYHLYSKKKKKTV